MPALKLLATLVFAAFALFAGLALATVAAVTGSLLFLAGHRRNDSPARRSDRSTSTAAHRPQGGNEADVIDVIATEVSTGPASR